MTISIVTAAIALGGVFTAFLIQRFLISKKNGLPLPPGPKGVPLLGNINDLPKPGVLECHHWATFKDKYGPISSITVLGQTFVIINDADLSLELLRDRAAINSERPTQEFSGNMIGWNEVLAFLQYTDKFRTYRKIIAKVVSSGAALARFDRVQEEEAAHFVLNVLRAPQDLAEHLRKSAGGAMLGMLYGYKPVAHGLDPLIDLTTKTLDDFSVASVPGKYAVDMIPWLKYLPDWVPGTGFKREARIMENRLSTTFEKPYAFVKQQMREKKNRPSFMSQVISEMERDGYDPEMEKIFKYSGVSMTTGAADTTVSALLTFFLAMTLYPDVQKKAQEEIDRVIGSQRLPVSSDRDKLPYVEAVIKETHRWHPIAPMSIPHVSREEQTIRGYRIPKGSMILPNSWWSTHNPDVFPEPMTFRPERFLEPAKDNAPLPDPNLFVFGYGRRICPGKQIADSTLFITVAQTLSVFDISKRVKNGKVVEPEVIFTPGVISPPKPFETSVKPRSEAHRKLIEKMEEKYPWVESDAEALNAVQY